MKARIYTDTSVIGGCLEKEFKEPSVRLFEWFEQGRAIIVVSDLTLLELQNSPEEVQEILNKAPAGYREDIEMTDEAADLAEKYIREGVAGKAQKVDAQHIAIATLSRVDVLVSWNFRHIVNLTKIRGYNSVNMRYGLPSLEIRTPVEVIEYEEEKKGI